MSPKGDCWESAMAESFFKTLKVELGSRFPSRQQARRELLEYIKRFYNTRRLHSGIGYHRPAEYERLVALQEAA
ncbi:MAG TPA: IS3 family transposase [Thermoanaerobaculia bacterium]|nr:IS3 family transposase [Thermoanaerobaculia bacterium]